MRHSRFGLAGALFLGLALGSGVAGCQDDEETVQVDLEGLCAQSLEDMNSAGCKDTLHAIVASLQQCIIDCGMEEGDCVKRCLADPDTGLAVCSAGGIPFLLSGVCGTCYAGCAFAFVGDDSDPGCLPDPANAADECLDELYTCVNNCSA